MLTAIAVLTATKPAPKTWSVLHQLMLAGLRRRVEREIEPDPGDDEEVLMNHSLRKIAKLITEIDKQGPNGY